MVLEGPPSHETFFNGTQRELEISSVSRQPPSMVGEHISSPRLVAKSPSVLKGTELHPKGHSILIFSDALNIGGGGGGGGYT